MEKELKKLRTKARQFLRDEEKCYENVLDGYDPDTIQGYANSLISQFIKLTK